MENTKRIFDYLESKYSLGYIGLFKAISVATMFISNKDIIPLSVLCIAPSGQFKSRSTIELPNIFLNKSIIDLGSDFTANSLIEQYDSGKKCKNKTLTINDLTLLFSSKSPRTKARLINALAEILSEGKYQYSERLNYGLVFEARINIICNITKNSFAQNKKNFLDNTFLERLVPFHYSLTDQQQESFARDITKRKQLCFDKKIRLKKIKIVNFEEYNEELIQAAKQYKSVTLSSSLPRSIEKVKAIIGGISVLNHSETISSENFQWFNIFLEFFSENYNKKSDIIRLHKEGLSVSEICKQLNYQSTYPYKIIQEYKQKGVLS